MSYTICNVLDLGVAYTGATMRAQLYDSANTPVGSAITTGFYERSGGKGIYTLVLSIPDSHVGWCDVYVDGAPSNILATLPINPSELENADIKTSSLQTSVSSILAITGTSGVVLSTATLQAIADQVLKRGASHVDGAAEENSLYELIQINTNAALAGTVLTIHQTNGTTVFNTRTIVLDAAALPVASIA